MPSPVRASFRSRLAAAAAANTAAASDLPSSAIDFARRGRRLDAADIAAEFYGGHVGDEWVHAHVRYRCRVSYRVVLWWEYDVRAHLEEERRAALAREPAYTRPNEDEERSAA